MWGKIIIPMYRLWLNGLYGLYGPRYPLSSKRPINLISLSLSLWEFDRLGSDHRSGCVQWIVVTNRAVNSSRVDRQYRRCQPSVASVWTRNGPSLHNLWKARKSDTNRGHWVHQTKCYGGKRKLSTLAGSPFLFTNEGRLGWETVKPSDWLVAESVSGSTELGQWMK